MKSFGYLLCVMSWLWLVALYAQPFGGFIRHLFRPWPAWLNWLFELPWPPPMGASIWPVALGLFGTILGFTLTQIARGREMEIGYHDH